MSNAAECQRSRNYVNAAQCQCINTEDAHVVANYDTIVMVKFCLLLCHLIMHAMMSTNSVITNGDNQWCLKSRCFAMDSYCEPGSRCSGILWRNHECTSTSWHDNIGRRPHTGSSAITTDRGSWTQMTHKGAAPASSEVWIQHSFIHWMLMLMLHDDTVR